MRGDASGARGSSVGESSRRLEQSVEGEEISTQEGVQREGAAKESAQRRAWCRRVCIGCYTRVCGGLGGSTPKIPTGALEDGGGGDIGGSMRK